MRFNALMFVVVLCACTPQSVTRSAGIVGPNDMVLIDQLDEGKFAAAGENNQRPDGGINNQFFIVTSSDTSELKVMLNYRPTLQGRDFYPAPNPLETLAIAVPDRPTMLAVDEGLARTDAGVSRRVTGSYVYSSRAGASQIAVVGTNPSEFKQVIPALPTGAPLSAMVAFFDAPTGSAVFDSLPPTTSLYFATFDGAFGQVFQVSLPTDVATLRKNKWPAPERVLSISNASIASILVLPPLVGRALNGESFCDQRSCLVIASRSNAGKTGRTFLYDPATERSADLDFPAPVRELKMALDDPRGRVFGILDEEACGSPRCAGIVGIDTTQTTNARFPVLKDFTGQPMKPLISGSSIPQGLTLLRDDGTGGLLRQTTLSNSTDAGSTALVLSTVGYRLLGAYTSSDGQLTFFDAEQGVDIDYDGRRSTIASATFNELVRDSDGGVSILQSNAQLTASIDDALNTSKLVTLALVDAGTTRVDMAFEISDGYFQDQILTIQNGAEIPGVFGVPQLGSQVVEIPLGLETRVRIGDSVDFMAGNVVCSTQRIRQISGTTATVENIPAGCSQPSDGGVVPFTYYRMNVGTTDSIIVSSDIEGYIGRGAPGASLSYQGRYQHRPQSVSGGATALKVTLPPSLAANAFWQVSLAGRFTPYRTRIDLNVCSASFLGRPILGRLPTNVQNNFRVLPTLMMTSPSANAVIEVNLEGASAGILTQDNGIACRQ